MRIVLFMGSLTTGGAQWQFSLLGRELKRAGHDVLFLTMESGDDNPAYERLLEGVERQVVLGSPWPGPLRLIQLLRGWRPVRRELERFQADVIYAGLEWPDWLAARAVAGMAKRPAVVAGIRNSAESMSWKRRLPLKRLAAHGRLDGLIANSEAGLAEAHRIGIRSSLEEVIPNGIDTDFFSPDPESGQQIRESLGLPSDVVLLGHVGRLSPMKDHDTLLQAMAILLESHPGLHLACLGDGPVDRRQELRQLVTSLGMDGHVHWIANESNMPAFYSAIDLLVMSSCDEEGFPNAVAEAMACEIPCAVTTVGEAASIVGNTGMVSPPRDPEALARVIHGMLETTDRGPAARARIVETFGIRQLVQATESVLDRALVASRCGSK